jgi:uroporphyrinogen decarboxylase
MTEMTPRERVLAAVNHREPDRVPLDIGSSASTGIVVEGYEQLKRYLGMPGETEILNPTFRVARLDERVLRLLGSDCRPLTARAPARKTATPTLAIAQSTPTPEAGTFTDTWGVTWRRTFYGDGHYYWELARNPLAEATIADLERYPWPDPTDPDFTAGLAEEAKALHQDTGYAVVADSGFKSFWETSYMLRGLEQTLVDLASDPQFVSALLSKVLEINLVAAERFLGATGRYIDILRATDDLASQRGPLMSMKMFRRFLKPVYKQYFDFVKSRTDAKILFHSCGNVVDLLDDLIEAGVDIINPVQVSAMGPVVADLKTRFGDRIVFWGGVDTQHVLPHGSPGDVEAEVRHRIHEFGAGGGFVLSAVHNIQPDVPPQNIIALAEATRKHGRYPLAPE